MRDVSCLLSEMGFRANVDRAAVEGLKFSAALPLNLAIDTLAERGSDISRALVTASEPLVIRQK
jgi:hypothetical protein